MGENLELLKELTESLPAFPTGEVHPLFNKYHLDKGTCLSWLLFNNGVLSVDKWFNSAGTHFPEHVHHNIKEVIIVFEGSMIFAADGVQTTLKKGDLVCTQPNQLHSAEMIEDCWYLTITIPPANEFMHNK